MIGRRNLILNYIKERIENRIGKEGRKMKGRNVGNAPSQNIPGIGKGLKCASCGMGKEKALKKILKSFRETFINRNEARR